MRLFKSLMVIVCATAIALAYVHVQVELVKLSYSINYKEKKLKDILDLKESLSYNIANLEDPSRLESILLAKKIDISFPKRDHVFREIVFARSKRAVSPHKSIGIERKAEFPGILEFFNLRAEAHATER